MYVCTYVCMRMYMCMYACMYVRTYCTMWEGDLLVINNRRDSLYSTSGFDYFEVIGQLGSIFREIYFFNFCFGGGDDMR